MTSSELKTKSPLELYPKLLQISKQWTQCADCDDKHPKWAEIIRGILICLQCSGVHRSLGTHCSKVRSLTLDKWTQEMVDNMVESNTVFNAIWEYHVDENYMKPTSKTRRDIRKRYIKTKYIGHKDYSVSKKLIPAFHKDQFGPKQPVFASKEYDESIDDEKKRNDRKATVGMVEYTGVIKIFVIGAKDLPNADVGSASDPYVVFENSSGQAVKTKVIDDDNNPIWNEHLVLSVNENEPVSIKVFDKDKFTKDDLLCVESLNVAKQCKNGEEIQFVLNMKLPKDAPAKWKKNRPTLKFKVVYDKMDAH